MRFLCLHGMGTNNQVFNMQTAALRYELGDHHSYEFVEGTVPSPIAPEIRSLFAASDEFFAYFDTSSVESCQKALHDLNTFISTDGPFDGVIAFSQGAALASTLLVQKFREQPTEQHLNPIFKCAIFISGGTPVDPDILAKGELHVLSAEVDGELIPIPTAHIWGRNDTLYPGSSAELSKLCKEATRTEFIHDGGHEVPASGTDDLRSTVQAIRRTVHKALLAQ